MADTKEDPNKERLKRELEGKNVAHYSVMLSAWLDTKMEHERSLITLSSGGIALLVTLLSTVGMRYWSQILLFSLAIVALLITILTSLWIFRENCAHIENNIKGQSTTNLTLRQLDKLALSSFVAGIILATIGGVTGAVMQKKEVLPMGKNERPEPKGEKERITESFDGVENLRPDASKPQPEKPGEGQNSSGKQGTEK